MKRTLTRDQKDRLLNLINETIIPAIHEDVIGDYEEEDEDAAYDLYHEAIEFIVNNL